MIRIVVWVARFTIALTGTVIVSFAFCELVDYLTVLFGGKVYPL